MNAGASEKDSVGRYIGKQMSSLRFSSFLWAKR